MLGRKWLFKQEDPALWSIGGGGGGEQVTREKEVEGRGLHSENNKEGWLALKTGCVGIDSPYPANMLLQRPTAAYYRVEARLRWPGAVPDGDGWKCEAGAAAAGVIARELNSGQGVAVGLACNRATGVLEVCSRCHCRVSTASVATTAPFTLCFHCLRG